MTTVITKQIKLVTPEDDKKLDTFHYISAGVAGPIAVKLQSGAVVIIPSTIVTKMEWVPVGQMDEVLATGTTATDIVTW